MGIRPAGSAFCVLACAALVLAASSAGDRNAEARWRQLAHVAGALDVAGPRADGRFVVASLQGLYLLRRNGATTPFARGAGGYVAPVGESYIALAQNRRVPGAGCSFRRDVAYALDPTAPGLTLIGRTGQARRFVNLPTGSFLSSIAFDTVGRFGYRLLVTAIVSNQTTLYSIDCRGRIRTVVSGAPKVEGGSTVAPKSFKPFGGRLIAADEVGGGIYAFDARGHVRLVARPKLSMGPDLGVESLGFVPPGFRRSGDAYLADLGAPGSPTQGTDSVLSLPAAALVRAGVRAGDLLVATEAGGVTIRIRCSGRCTTRRIARALEATHGEGHIAFAKR